MRKRRIPECFLGLIFYTFIKDEQLLCTRGNKIYNYGGGKDGLESE